MTKKTAVVELIFAGAIWGFGFVAAVWALKDFTPTETLVYRFLAATAMGELLYLITNKIAKRPSLHSAKEDFLLAIPAGSLLGGLVLFQTIGLKYTTATKSSFITSLYVIFVPLVNAWFLKKSSRWYNYAFALLALLGTLMLINADFKGINQGDLWTLGCAVLATFHIIYIGQASGKVGNAFRFNNFQSFWSLVVLAPLLLFQNTITWKIADPLAWTGVLVLGLGSSLIAFYIQVRAQKVLSDGTASMIFLLEAPFAALFGYLLLSEKLNLFQTSGAVLIMLASILQILSEPSSKKNP